MAAPNESSDFLARSSLEVISKSRQFSLDELTHIGSVRPLDGQFGVGQ